MNYLPSKRVFPLLVASVLALSAVVGAVIWSKRIVPENKPTTLAFVETNTIEKKIAELDSDSDGLKDWEENILSTDPKVADTDGDGTTDGEEVNTGRNPLVKGPKDKQEVTDNTKVTTKSITSNTPANQTQTIAQEFFNEYMAIKQSGGTLSEEQQSQLIENIIARGGYRGVSPKFYGASDLTTVANNANTLRAYGNAVALAISRNNSSQLSENELVILEEAVDSQSATVLKKLDPAIVAYNKIINDLLAVSVPSSLTVTHLNLVNGFSIAVQSIESFRKVFDDPALSLSSIQNYLDASTQMMDAIRSINKSIAGAGIVYNVDESGYNLTLLGV